LLVLRSVDLREPDGYEGEDSDLAGERLGRGHSVLPTSVKIDATGRVARNLRTHLRILKLSALVCATRSEQSRTYRIDNRETRDVPLLSEGHGSIHVLGLTALRDDQQTAVLLRHILLRELGSVED
jgi:hypothetical protein